MVYATYLVTHQKTSKFKSYPSLTRRWGWGGLVPKQEKKNKQEKKIIQVLPN